VVSSEPLQFYLHVSKSSMRDHVRDMGSQLLVASNLLSHRPGVSRRGHLSLVYQRASVAVERILHKSVLNAINLRPRIIVILIRRARGS
jgi:hypothetical protein